MPGKQPQLAKISRPLLYNAVARERLFSLLDAVREHPLIWVVGPPGAGKTTLVATYLQSRNSTAVWYQVDPGDSDPAAFFYYLGLAVVTKNRKRQRAFPVLTPEHLGDLSGFTRRFFRQLFSLLPPKSVVVLDNFQEAGEAALCAILRDGCAEIPPAQSIIVVSRTDPPASFVELEARQALISITWRDLRLTLEETRLMSAARALTEDWLVRALHEQSDGWAAGVTLMLERLRHAGGDGRSVQSEAREVVFNYFASLILQQTSEEAQRVLMSLAFLPHFTTEVAREVSGSEEVGKLLHQLYRRHLFIDRRPAPEPVYQFHALFREFLQNRAFEVFASDEVAAMLDRSARAAEAAGEAEAAFQLYARTADWPSATRLILSEASALLNVGRWQTLERWIAAVPSGVAEQEPWLDYWLASAQAQTNPAHAIATFERAQRRFHEMGQRVGRALSLAGLLHACSVDHMDYETMAPWLDVLADELQWPPTFASADVELQVWGALLWTAFFLKPWHRCIPACRQKIESLLEGAVSPNLALGPANTALAVASQIGDLDRSERLASRVDSLITHPGVSPVNKAWGLYQIAFQRFIKASYEASLEYFDRARAFIEAEGLEDAFPMVLIQRFMVEFRICNQSIEEATLTKMEMLPVPKHPTLRALLCDAQARRALWRGHPRVTADLAERCQAEIVRSRSLFHEMTFGLINADLLLSAGRVEEAKLLIARSRELNQRSEPLTNQRATLLLMEARLAHQEGRGEESLRLLREALVASRANNGWCRMRCVDAAMQHMFKLAFEHDIETARVVELIRLFRLRPLEPYIEAWPWPIRLRALGQFEVLMDQYPLEFGRKTPKKALALLKGLIAFGPGEVPEQRIVDALWPDEEGDAAHRSLGITVLRLRRLVGDNDLIRHQGGTLSIDRQKCWVDAWAFEQFLGNTAVDGVATDEEVAALERALSLYDGTFLSMDMEEPWTVPMRERLRAKFIHALGSLGKHLESRGRCEVAIGWYLKGLDADPIVEAFYQGLMRCYDKLDRRTEAIGAYRRLRQTLSVVLGIKPSASTESLYQSLR